MADDDQNQHGTSSIAGLRFHRILATVEQELQTALAKARLESDHGTDRVMTAIEQAYMKQIGMVPPYFVVAFDNKVAPDTIGDRLQAVELVEPPAGKSMGEEDWANTRQPPLDAICILGKGLYLYVRPNNPLGMQISFEQPDGSKTVREELSGWAYVETDARLVLTMAWLDAAIPRVFRGQSVFSPYLFPPMRHAKYMRARNERAPTGE